MGQPHLVIGNKTYSSWSLRPWIAMTVAGVAFTEEVIALDVADTHERIAAHSKAGRVPVLHHGDVTVWESLAIIEYVAEAYPAAALWPTATKARATARAVACEMHAGFTALRSDLPMNMRRKTQRLAVSQQVEADVRRIEAIWAACIESFGHGGPFLFGRFTAADAMFAPVVNRLAVYDVPVSDLSRGYMDAVMALPAWQSWKAAAAREPWVIAAEEV